MVHFCMLVELSKEKDLPSLSLTSNIFYRWERESDSREIKTKQRLTH